jgi:hypothetical protein
LLRHQMEHPILNRVLDFALLSLFFFTNNKAFQTFKGNTCCIDGD